LRLRPSLWFLVLRRGGWVLGLLLVAAGLWRAGAALPEAAGALRVGRSMALGGLGLLLLGNVVEWCTRVYALTPRVVSERGGVLRHLAHELALERVQTVSVSATLLERALGVGTVVATGSGGLGAGVQWGLVANPGRAAGEIRSALAARVAAGAGPGAAAQRSGGVAP
jgi:hypothetical protein